MLALGLSLSLASLAGCGLTGETLGQDSAGSIGVRSLNRGPRTQVRIYFSDPAQLDAMARHGVDLFENVDRAHGYVDATVTAKSEAYLKQQGIRFTVTQNADALQSFSFPKGYQTVASVTNDLQALAASHPSFIHLQTFGKSLEGRPLVTVELTSHPGAHLPSVLIGSGIHARELPPVELTTRLIHLLADGYGQDPAITNLVDTRDIWIVPFQNPDGRIRVEKGDAMWRKNARVIGGQAVGVDNNRNADDHFSQGDNQPDEDDYRGSAPFSEPETQALRDLYAQHHFAVSIDIHNYAGMILWPPGYSNGVTKDDSAFRAIGNHLAQHIGYKAGTIAQTIYNTYGDVATWAYDTQGTLAFAAELNDSGFDAPYSEVTKDWSDWKDNLLYLIDVSGHPKNAQTNAGFLAAFPTL